MYSRYCTPHTYSRYRTRCTAGTVPITHTLDIELDVRQQVFEDVNGFRSEIKTKQRCCKIIKDSSLEIRSSRFEYLKYNGKKNIRHDNLWK